MLLSLVIEPLAVRVLAGDVLPVGSSSSVSALLPDVVNGAARASELALESVLSPVPIIAP
jgi:hypothetical protein